MMEIVFQNLYWRWWFNSYYFIRKNLNWTGILIYNSKFLPLYKNLFIYFYFFIILIFNVIYTLLFYYNIYKIMYIYIHVLSFSLIASTIPTVQINSRGSISSKALLYLQCACLDAMYNILYIYIERDRKR